MFEKAKEKRHKFTGYVVFNYAVPNKAMHIFCGGL